MAKKPHKLTPKQENFCWKYIETGNAHTAYIKAYDVYSLDWKKDWTYTEASNLLNNPKITQRLEEIKAELSKSSFINLDRILFELEQARMTAHSKKDVQGMVKATATKARILGLDKLEEINRKLDKQLEEAND
uniref:Terminase small subunit n=1 Tax=Histophilus somni (strain 129Pt) TaxID=205914 RepID=Q0I4P9_HISS1